MVHISSYIYIFSVYTWIYVYIYIYISLQCGRWSSNVSSPPDRLRWGKRARGFCPTGEEEAANARKFNRNCQDGAPKIAFSWFISGWILWFMVDITNYLMGIIMVYKPTNITGGPHPGCSWDFEGFYGTWTGFHGTWTGCSWDFSRFTGMF